MSERAQQSLRDALHEAERCINELAAQASVHAARADAWRSLVIEHHAIGAMDDCRWGGVCPVCDKRAHVSIRHEMGLPGPTPQLDRPSVETIARELCARVVGCNECCRPDAGQCDEMDALADALRKECQVSERVQGFDGALWFDHHATGDGVLRAKSRGRSWPDITIERLDGYHVTQVAVLTGPARDVMRAMMEAGYTTPPPTDPEADQL